MTGNRAGEHREDLDLRARNAELEALYQALPDLCFRVTRDTTVVDFKPGLGLDPYVDPEQFMGRRMSELLPEPAAGLCASAVARVADNGTPESLEYALPYPDGNHHYEARVVRIDAEYLLLAVREISDRVDALARLRASEQRFRDFAATGADWYWETDAEDRITSIGGGDYDQVIGVPESKVVGHTRREMLGIYTDDPGAVATQADAIDARQAFRGAEANWRNPLTGESHRLAMSGMPVYDHQGRYRGFRGTTRDVTARHRLENQLRHAQRLEAIGQLAGGIAHDFNNILGTILGYTHLVQERYLSALPDDVARHLQEIQRAAERGRDIVAGLLAYARGVPGDPRVMNTGALLADAGELLRSVLPETMRVDLDWPDPLPPVRVDPVQFSQIILNLAVNARDASEGAGEVRVCAAVTEAHGECASCHAELAGRQISITVADHGHGIAPQHLARVFEPFFTTRDVGEGTGLGLAMVHGLIHEHHGHLQINSRLGAGTRMTLLLPVATQS